MESWPGRLADMPAVKLQMRMLITVMLLCGAAAAAWFSLIGDF